jgi:hypothetical protein
MNAALIKGLTAAEREARIVGFNQGWDHANYADTFQEEISEEPTGGRIPERFKVAGVEHYFTSGWAEGVDDFRNTQYEG